MSAAVACTECGSPVFAEDRFCGACGAPQGLSRAGVAYGGTYADRAAKLLAELRALTVGEYEIRGEIGRGGMAVVYLAYDLRLNRKVAIKAMLPDLAFHAGMEERFKREARTAAQLDHPNIVVIYSVRDSGDPMFFVMKYVDGAPLDAVIRGHAPLPIPVVQGLLVQLCAALQYAHGDGVVHRDVKPANILIDRRGTVQVTDFGIAKAADSTQLTRTGFAIGTPAYMCPEQCLGHQQTPASDQYSLGVVAYELLTGRPPFAGSAVEIQWAHVKDAPRPVTELRPDCPPSLAAAVMRMLAKDPGERWPGLRDAVPLIASGLPPNEDGRTALAELVRVAPVTRPQLPMTPVSPVPRPVPPPEAAAHHPSPVPPARTPTPDRVEVASLDVAPRDCTMEVGTTECLRCRLLDARGEEISGAAATWSSSNPAIASVDETGVVAAHAPGHVTIAAMSGSLAAMSLAHVVPATVARVDVEPSVVSVEQDGMVQLTVRAYSTRGKAIPGTAVTFRTSDPTVATVDAEGGVRGVAAGRTTVVANVGDVDAKVIVMVTSAPAVEPAAPARRRLPVPALAGAGVAVVAVVAALTLARRSGGGTADRATSTGTVAVPQTAPASASAAAAPDVAALIPADTVVAALELTERSPLRVEAGETRALGMRAVNRRGEPIPNARATWTSSAPAVATVGPDGVLEAVAPGRTTVTARLGEYTRVVNVEVAAATVARMILSLGRDTVPVGESTPAFAELFDARGGALEHGVAWRSSNANVATVDEGGVVHAITAGWAMIVASTGAVTDSTRVVVRGAVTDAPDDSLRVASPSVRPVSPTSGVTPREVGALPPGAKVPSDAEARAVADSVMAMINRQVVRLTQLTRPDSEPAAHFQKFLETNDPTARLSTEPVVTEVRSTSARVAFGVVLQWEANSAQRERTVTLESLVEPVRGGWAIREVRFPSGFAP